MFSSLLRSSKIFKDNFWELNQKNKVVIDKPFSAKEFCTIVRSELMHETRGQMTIEWIDSIVRFYKYSTVFVSYIISNKKYNSF